MVFVGFAVKSNPELLIFLQNSTKIYFIYIFFLLIGNWNGRFFILQWKSQYREKLKVCFSFFFKNSCWNGSAEQCRGWNPGRRTIRWPVFRKSWKSTGLTGGSWSRPVSNRRLSSKRTSTHSRLNFVCPTGPLTCLPKERWFL